MVNALAMPVGLSSPMAPKTPSPMAPPPQAAANYLNPFMAPKPQENMWQRAADGFQRGFDPKGFQARQDQNKVDDADTAKKSIATLQQLRALPMQQRLAMTQQITQMTGKQIPEAMMSDQELDGQLALMQGQAGIAPPKQDPMSAYEAAQIKLKQEEAVKPTVVNNRVIDPNDPTKVIADYSDPAKVEEEKPPWPGAVKNEQGRWVYDENYLAGQKQLRSASGGGKAPQLTPYQQAQLLRQQKQDDQKANEKKHVADVRVSGLDESIQRVETFLKTPGFNDIYGLADGIGGMLGIPADWIKVPGSAPANALAELEQIGGNAFLAGVESMRGTGPLSDREGQAVKASVTRMLNRQQGDASARQAAQDFINSMKRLRDAYAKESKAQDDDDIDIDALFADVPQGQSGGLSSDEAEELRQLKAELGVQ